jgi:hypothetical protein
MNHSSELALRVPRPLLPPPLLLTDAHLYAEAAITRVYLEAYEKCAVPMQTTFNSYAELDDEILRQLELADFTLAIVPNIQARLDIIVTRIRNTWTRKYGLRFNGTVCTDRRAPPSALRHTSWTWRAGDHMAPGTLQRGPGGGAVNPFAAGIQPPNNAPATTTNYLPLGPPPRSDFTFRALPPTQPRNFRRHAGFAGNSVAPKPLFANAEEIRLTYFAKTYKSIDNIHSEEKREKTQGILVDMPNETVARCMEALFRCEDDVDRAEAWLRQAPADTKGKHVIELFDSDDEGQDPDYLPAKKKQKVENRAATKLAKQAKVERKRVNKDMGTLKKPSKKAMANLLASPKYEPFGHDNSRRQSLFQSSTTLGVSTQSNDAPAYIPLDVGPMAPNPGYGCQVPQSTQREVVDLTMEDTDPTDLKDPTRHPIPTVTKAFASNATLKSSQTFFGSARGVTPDPTIWENIFQDRSAAGISKKKPMTKDEIRAELKRREDARKLQSIAKAARAEKKRKSLQPEQESPAQFSSNTTQQQLQVFSQQQVQAQADNLLGVSMAGSDISDENNNIVLNAAGTVVRQVSELEEGEILEDEPTATVLKHEPNELNNSINDEHSSMTPWNVALPDSASHRDSGIGFNSSGFGASGKPVFGSVWQPGFGFRALS